MNERPLAELPELGDTADERSMVAVSLEMRRRYRDGGRVVGGDAP